jgi:hypothetical protein
MKIAHITLYPMHFGRLFTEKDVAFSESTEIGVFFEVSRQSQVWWRLSNFVLSLNALLTSSNLFCAPVGDVLGSNSK